MIRRRFSLAYPILALVSFAALGVAVPLYIISVNSLKKSINTMELSKAEQVHRIAESAIQSEVGKLTVMSKVLEKHYDLAQALKYYNDSGDSSIFTKTLTPVVAKLGVGFVKIIDPNEIIVYRNNTMISAEGNIWGVAEALQGQEIISTSRHPEGFAIRAITPVRDENYKVLGAVVAGFVINDEFIERISSLTKTNILIGSLQGTIATSKKLNKDQIHICKNSALIDDKIFESIQDDKTTHKILCDDNIHFFKRLMIVDEMFSLMVEIDTSQSQQLYSATRRKTAITAGGTFAIAWLLGIILTGTIIKPLKELRDKSCKTVSEITGDKIDVHSGNELDALVSAFTIMRDSLVTHIDGLQKAETELRGHRDHLEELVAERSENLRETNEQLQAEIDYRKRAEQELKNSNKRLKYVNQQLEEFIYAASHDLREPLRKISAFSLLLTKDLGEKLTGDQRENFGFMTEGANRMREIVESLLAYSRLMTRDFKLQNVDLNKIVNYLSNYQLSEKLKETGGILLIPEPLPTLQCDAHHIEEAFHNLIENGLIYHRRDIPPQVIVRAQTQDDGMIRIEVEDNGIGIKSEHYEIIFAMFRQLHSKEEYEGTGAGLAICKRIIEQHQGEIGVSSIYGKGAIFWFTLPSRQTVDTEQSNRVSGHET